jgi:hypothetical protein
MQWRQLAAALVLVGMTLAAARADALPGVIAAGTRLRFHLLAPVSSDQSKTGQAFTFVLLAPIEAAGLTVVAAGATGSGTVFLAGHAGTSGHEGDLTLRLDSIPTADGGLLTFADQRFAINGRNRKIQSGVLGLVPFVGVGAMFIRGSEVRVDADTPLETVLLRDATVAAVTTPGPSPLPSAAPT